ncbi:unnamed protein product [Musa acuminata subsp. burmannicoides]
MPQAWHEKTMDYHWRNASTMPVLCYPTSSTTNFGIWKGENPLDYTIPLFILQLLIIVMTSRVVAVLLHPFGQPRYVSEILGGLVLGPTVLGRIPGFLRTLFPYRSLPILEVIAHVGIIYFVFIIGLEIDPTSLQRTGKYAIFAAACVVFPFAVGAISGKLVHTYLAIETNKSSFLTFLGVTFSITSFSVLARTLTEHKLINTNLGLTTLSTAMFIDSWAWILLSMAFSLSSGNLPAIMWTMASGMVFILWSVKVVKPAVLWVSRRKPKGEVVGELSASVILVGVMVWALMADAIGINAVSGAFVYGLMIPYGPLGVALIERVDDFVEGLLLPLFFAICGLRSNLYSVTNVWAAVALAMVALLSAAAKVAACMSVGYLYDMPLNDRFAMGLLMSTKGVIEMVILKIGRDMEVLSEQAYSILVVMSVVITIAVGPLLKLATTSNRGQASYQRRTIMWPDPNSELRMQVCVHNTRNIPSMLGLLEACCPTKRSPVFVFALHLVELTGRASAMLVVHDTTGSASSSDPLQLHKVPLGRSRHMIQALESYAQRAAGVTIQPLTAVSSYSTMHVDVCGVAEDNCVALIVLPFHKQPTVDGDMQVINPAIHSLNQSVLANAPCSVAILVDHGLSGPSRMAVAQHSVHHVAVLFFGGPDDREALALASRMAEHPAVSLTVFRFIPGDDLATRPSMRRYGSNNSDEVLTLEEDEEKEEQLDEAYITEFRLKHVSDETVVYTEKVSNNAEETVAVIRSMEGIHDLYVVGKGGGSSSPLTEGLTEWCECPELGPIGDMLASNDFNANASVLVVQQGMQDEHEVAVGMVGESPWKPR